MIKDNIKNVKKFDEFSKRIALGLKYLQDNDFSHIASGKYEILKDEVYAIIQEYQTKQTETAQFEAHKNHIDIQFVISGEEQIGVADIDKFIEAGEYNAEKDIVFLSPKTEDKIDFYKLRSGEFIILEPKDAHMPSITIEEVINVKKIVIKVLV